MSRLLRESGIIALMLGFYLLAYTSRHLPFSGLDEWMPKIGDVVLSTAGALAYLAGCLTPRAENTPHRAA